MPTKKLKPNPLSKWVELPKITPLQFLVFSSIAKEELPGCDVRKVLVACGVRTSRAAFYQLMGRLEQSGYIDGAYRLKQLENQAVQERWYRITPKALATWRKACDFYAYYAALGVQW